ncbi:ribonuclease HII [Elusimicrobiota bacterium]
MDLNFFDNGYRNKGYGVIAGVDEAGRGPWAGPVVAAAVVLPKDLAIEGLNDSKKLSPKKREIIYNQICVGAACAGIGIIECSVIDNVNILQATYLAMKKAVSKLSKTPQIVLVDGSNKIPDLNIKQERVIEGDSKSASIAAASIIAKVTRDKIMQKMSEKYPQYGFEKHKGYGTRQHHDALLKFGPCEIHRKSFAPVRKFIEAIDDKF